ncbi:MAG TPA: nuclear transport factor 2 family protein [Thermodesulfobacteriota bacterium]|nr:nuclear transport factor 2 family protein [Thermodesulfobacteriota bacterium]
MPNNSDYEEVLKVNEMFYKALGTRNLELMDQVWVKDSRAGCVHPGWIILSGWQAIRQSWENVFDPNDQVDIRLSNITVEIKRDVAWVTCIQQLIYINRDPIGINMSQSTNIFERHDSGWLMILHHASPIPITNYEIADRSNLQ